MKKIIYSILVFMLCALFSGCPSKKEEGAPSLELLRIGILPDETKDKLIERYTPLFRHLSEEIDIPYKLIIPDRYDELVELFHHGKIDLAYFGGFTFVKAHIQDDAIPLVMRDVDTRFTSYYLVRADSTAGALADFKGKRFSFGSNLSTSGHLMPRHFMHEMGIIPEDFFSEVIYSGKHDLTAYYVLDGKADIGVANSEVIKKMYKDGRLSEKEVRILGETPPYPDYVWAAQSSLAATLREKIKDAFLNLSPEKGDHARILAGVDAGRFLPAEVSDFNRLTDVINDLELLDAAGGREKLLIGVTPYLTATELFKRFSPLVDYLGRKTGMAFSLKITADYQDCIDRLGNGSLDIAYLGSAGYVKMVDLYGERPIVARLETNGTPFFRSVIFVREESPLQTLADLAGKELAFGDQESTSSHIVPRHMLIEAGLSIDQLGGHQHLDNHNNVALGVLMGDYDAGGVKEEIFNKYEKRGLRRLAISSPIPEYLFVASSRLPSKSVEDLRKAFYSLKNDKDGESIMKEIKKGMTAFVPANDGDYGGLSAMVRVVERAVEKEESDNGRR